VLGMLPALVALGYMEGCSQWHSTQGLGKLHQHTPTYHQPRGRAAGGTTSHRSCLLYMCTHHEVCPATMGVVH
jgi:hypothetical protein